MDEAEERWPWERLAGESAEAFQAFCDYRGMVKASIDVLADRYREVEKRPRRPGLRYDGGPVPTRRTRTLNKWSVDYHWVERRTAWVEFQREVEAEAAAEESRRCGTRQARDAAKLQSSAMAVLDLFAGYDEETGTFRIDGERFGAIDIVRMWKAGFEAERALAGLASEIHEKQVKDLAELSDEDLDKLITEG